MYGVFMSIFCNTNPNIRYCVLSLTPLTLILICHLQAVTYDPGTWQLTSLPFWKWQTISEILLYLALLRGTPSWCLCYGLNMYEAKSQGKNTQFLIWLSKSSVTQNFANQGFQRSHFWILYSHTELARGVRPQP